MDNYNVTFVFEYCTITASCYAEHEESAPDLAWDWVLESLGNLPYGHDQANDVIVERK